MQEVVRLTVVYKIPTHLFLVALNLRATACIGCEGYRILILVQNRIPVGIQEFKYRAFKSLIDIAGFVFDDIDFRNLCRGIALIVALRRTGYFIVVSFQCSHIGEIDCNGFTDLADRIIHDLCPIPDDNLRAVRNDIGYRISGHIDGFDPTLLGCDG